MHRERRPVFVQTNLARIVGRACSRGRRREDRGNAPSGEPASHGFLRLEMKAQRFPISSSLRMSAQGGILFFLPFFTVVTKRVLSSGKTRRSGVMVPGFIMLGPWQCEHFSA